MPAFVVLLIVSVGVQLPGVEPEDLPDTRSPKGWQSFDPADYGEEWMVLDRDDDGVVDYAVMLNEDGQKLREAVDFNRDGFMDDFYFYENDVLQREEIDSNYDRHIDIWIYLRRGVYITMWERDRDHDGVIDAREIYGNEHE